MRTFAIATVALRHVLQNCRQVCMFIARQTLLIAPLRPLGDYDIASLHAFLTTLTSFTEQSLAIDAGVPRSLPSGLAPPSAF